MSQLSALSLSLFPALSFFLLSHHLSPSLSFSISFLSLPSPFSVSVLSLSPIPPLSVSGRSLAVPSTVYLSHSISLPHLTGTLLLQIYCSVSGATLRSPQPFSPLYHYSYKHTQPPYSPACPRIHTYSHTDIILTCTLCCSHLYGCDFTSFIYILFGPLYVA